AGLDDGSNRTEALSAEDAHLQGHVGYHGRLEHVAYVVAATQHFRALRRSLLDLLLDERSLGRTDQRTDDQAGLARVGAVLQVFHLGSEALAELVVDAGFNDDARTGHADLALVHEVAEGG